ncbi:MAG: hypothetical protein A2Z52_00470 [Candidatus Moranbacteria bacterium RBG_19FT_COMBO_42_6]|nr:MAG: hypothetical protein A2Z52_00470 [Candidatus Moranbacteria bacterium RBG_19FT_COMBO_42_6]
MPDSGINYLEIIKNAARITWRNRYLWWFGFFILLSSTMGSSFQYSSREKIADREKIFEFAATHREWIIFAGLAALAVWIALLAVGIIGKGALIKSVNSLIEKKETSFKGGWKEGKKYFWKIFFIGIFSAIFILATLLVFMIPIGFLFYNKAYFLGGLLSLLALLIFIPVVFLASFIRIYGYLYAILSDLPLGESLENAYALLNKNIVPSIVISLIFLAIATLATMVALLFIIPVLVAFFIIGTLLFFLAKQVGIIVTVILGTLFILAVMIFGGSVYQVFTHAILVLFFREIATPKIKEEVEVEKVVELGPAHASEPVSGN